MRVMTSCFVPWIAEIVYKFVQPNSLTNSARGGAASASSSVRRLVREARFNFSRAYGWIGFCSFCLFWSVSVHPFFVSQAQAGVPVIFFAAKLEFFLSGATIFLLLWLRFWISSSCLSHPWGIAFDMFGWHPLPFSCFFLLSEKCWRFSWTFLSCQQGWLISSLALHLRLFFRQCLMHSTRFTFFFLDELWLTWSLYICFCCCLCFVLGVVGGRCCGVAGVCLVLWCGWCFFCDVGLLVGALFCWFFGGLILLEPFK